MPYEEKRKRSKARSRETCSEAMAMFQVKAGPGGSDGGGEERLALGIF